MKLPSARPLEQRLSYHLNPVGRTLRRVDFWRSATGISYCGTLMALMVFFLIRLNLFTDAGQWSIALATVATTCLAGSFFAARYRYRDSMTIARHIERHFPSLQQCLITAVEQQPGTGGTFGVLQGRLIEHAMMHPTRPEWPTSAGRLGFWTWGAGSGFVLLATSLATLFFWSDDVASSSRLSQPQPLLTTTIIQVDPGDTVIERGTSLVVSATFPLESIPSEVELLAINGEQVVKYPMSRSLADPLFGATMAAIQSDTVYRIAFDRQFTRDYHVSVFDYPELVRADAAIEYPDYTSLPDRDISDTRRVSAVEGSRVVWQCRVNKPLASVDLVSEAGETIPLELDKSDALQYRVEVSVVESATYELQLKDTKGRANIERITLAVQSVPNSSPEFTLHLARDTRVTPLQELPVHASVVDDYGIVQRGVTYQMIGHPMRESVLNDALPRLQSGDIEELISIESFNAQPGQVVTYHFWAEDYDARGDIRRTVTDLFFADIRPFDEIFRQGDSSQPGESASAGGAPSGGPDSELLELQKQVITATWNVARRERPSNLSDTFAADIALIIDGQATVQSQFLEFASTRIDAAARERITRLIDASIEHLQTASEQRTVTPLADAIAAQQAIYQELLALQESDFKSCSRTKGMVAAEAPVGKRFKINSNNCSSTSKHDATRPNAKPNRAKTPGTVKCGK